MKTNTLRLVLLMVLCIFGHMARAQQPRQLSLKEAVQLSLQNNKQLLLTKAKADEVNGNYKEALDNRLPDFKVSGSYLRVNNPDVKLKIKTGSSSSGSGESAGTPKVDQVVYGMANVSLPFFSGFRLKYAIEAAKYLDQASKLDVESNKQEVIQNTINAYGNLYKSYKTIDLVKENLKQQQRRVADFSNLEKNGLMARNDLLKAQLQQSNVELALLDAQSNYRVTCVNMSLMLGLPENTEIIPDSLGTDGIANTNSLPEWEDKAIGYRKDIAAMAMRQKAANSAIKSTKGEYYPGFAVTGGYVAADIHNLLTVTNALNIGLGLQYNVSSIWKTSAKLGVQKARLHQVEINQSMLTDQVRMDVTRAYEQYMLALKKIEVYKVAIEQANENYRITKNKYDNALVTTTDLLDADYTQLQANLNYTFSGVDAMIAFRKLQQVAGLIDENLTNRN